LLEQQKSDPAKNGSGWHRQVIFIDEMPWMDTPRSGFLQALEHFWNSWASGQERIILLVCGSATTWITNKLLENYGGLYNRVTAQMHLQPFSLAECEEYYRYRGMEYNRFQIIQGYMVFGGIPHYMSLMDPAGSLETNINALCFGPNAELKQEFSRMFASLFRNPEPYASVVKAVGQLRRGMTRSELEKATSLGSGGDLSRVLTDLENSGFIRRYLAFGKKAKGSIYQLLDQFTLFYLQFMQGSADKDSRFWQAYANHGSFYAWRGYSFETLCLTHFEQIKRSLGIGGVMTRHSAWRSEEYEPGAQIDLVIDRADGTINLCEMKISNAEYLIDKSDEQTLRNKLAAFEYETKTRKAVRLTLVTPYGVKRTIHSGIVNSQVVMDDLFVDSPI
jgi:hypothetical protein